MEKLLSALSGIPEYAGILNTLKQGKTAAVTGIGQINRSHLLSGLVRQLQRPMVLFCQDDLAAKRLQEELNAFLGISVPVLPGRELTMYDSAVVSRGWEHKRMRQLHDLHTGKTVLQIMSWESLSQRTMPPVTLQKASFSLKVGQQYQLEDLLQKLLSFCYCFSTI